jgi:thiazole biosynthesis enzyme
MEQIVSNGIIDSYFNKLKQYLSVDVAIVGGGPSGLVASYYLAKNNYKVAVYERKLAPGGGMWGGAMMFNEIVVQRAALHILDELSIKYREFENDFYVIDSVHAASALIYNATKAGVKIFNCTSVEDVVFLDNKVCGIVLNWAPVVRERLEVDPLVIMAKAVVDSTGHDCAVAHTLERKNNCNVVTVLFKMPGEINYTIKLYNVFGQLLATTKGISNEGENITQLYINEPLKESVYIVILHDNFQLKTKKVLLY